MSKAASGPVTAQGKFEASKNALSHGLTASNIDRFPESIREDYTIFLAEQYAEWFPATTNEELYVNRYAFAQFQVLRAQPIAAAAHEEFLENPTDPLVQRHLQTISRYIRGLERVARETLKELRTLIADRLVAHTADQALEEASGEKLQYPILFPHHLVTERKAMRRSPEANAARYLHQLKKGAPPVSASA
jgi:hypothetical protein